MPNGSRQLGVHSFTAAKLPREFYLQDTLTAAQALLGKVLVRRTPAGECRARIVETEAYLGVTDKASHCYGGTRTARTQVLYGPPGHAYIYLIYGMYCCLNLVTQPEDVPQCVLLRALEPLSGQQWMSQNRPRARREEDLCSGPGKLCQALGLSRGDSGLDVCGDSLFVADDGFLPAPEQIAAGPRIHIAYAGEAAQYPWRFWLRGNPCLSVKEPCTAG